MRLSDLLVLYDGFLESRLVSDRRRRWLANWLERDLFPEIGRRLVDSDTAKAQLPSWIHALHHVVKAGDIYGLHGFARFLARTRKRRSVGEAIDAYLVSLQRMSRSARTLQAHRRALVKLVRHLAAEALVTELSEESWRAAIQPLLARGNKDLTSALHHFVDLLAARGFASAPLDLFATVAPSERQLSLSHIISVRDRLRRLEEFMRDAGRLTPDAVRSQDLVQYREAATARGVGGFYRDLSVIRGFYAFLKRTGEVELDPTLGVRAKVTARCPRRALDLEQLRALLAAPLEELQHDPLGPAGAFPPKRRRLLAVRDHAILAVLIETGLRPSEIVALRLDDLDLAQGVLQVTGKGSRSARKRERLAYVESDTLRNALRDYLAMRPLTRYGILFLSWDVLPLLPAAIHGLVRRRAYQAGIDHSVCPYDLRVSFASRLVVQGMDPLALRVLMGHDNIQTTFKLYANLSLEEVRDVWRETNPLAPPTRDPGGAA